LPPLSLCNDPCPLGKRKHKVEGQKFCCYACSRCPEKMISRQIGGAKSSGMLGIIAILLFPELAMKIQPLKCTGDEAIQIPQKWYQDGDLLIGGLMSHVQYMSPSVPFDKRPSEELISYGSFQLAAHDESCSPPFYRMAPDETLQYEGLVQLLLYFGWKWVGLVIVDDKHGEHFIQTLEPMLSQNKICSEFTERVDRNLHSSKGLDLVERCLRHITLFTEKTANAVIIHRENTIPPPSLCNYPCPLGKRKKIEGWKFCCYTCSPCPEKLISRQMGAQCYKEKKCWEAINKYHRVLLELKGLLLSQEDSEGTTSTASSAGATSLGKLSDEQRQLLDKLAMKVQPLKCTGEEALKIPQEWYEEGELLIGGLMSHIHYLFPEISFKRHPFEESVDFPLKGSNFKKKLHPFLQRISFNNNVGDEIKLNEDGTLKAGFDIVNLITFPNSSYINIPVGEIDPRAPPGKFFLIHQDKIQWHHEFTQLPPLSLCNDPCPLGKIKNKIEGKKFCCYACARCMEKMISRQI
ncbi:hypothetical protein E2320_003454, partial [Naja naja]